MRKPRAINPWSVFFEGLMSLQRTVSLIDGFNLYHAISSLKCPELKWVNLRILSGVFINSSNEQLVNVFYFSAYADHVAAPVLLAQKAYIKALQIAAIHPVLGYFKKKDRKCPSGP
jgi:hypothetical protein